MSNILAIDTTIGGCSVAHSNGASQTIDERNKQTSQLTAMVEAVMQDTRFDDLDAYAVTIGPGSFTGVRIGLAFVRGLALAKPKPIYAITTLELLAYQAIEAGAEGEILSAVNAHRNQLYLQSFAVKEGIAIATDEACAINLEDIPKGEFALAGDAEHFFDNHDSIAKLPNAESLARYAQKLPLPKLGDKPAPIYLRAPDAKAQKGDLTVAQ